MHIICRIRNRIRRRRRISRSHGKTECKEEEDRRSKNPQEIAEKV